MRCGRCGGLAVADYFSGGETIFEGWSYAGFRCVNCGAVAGAPAPGAQRRHPAAEPLREGCDRPGPRSGGRHNRRTASARARRS
jgi:hypothetical protein